MGRLLDALSTETHPPTSDYTWHVRNLVREAIMFAVDEQDPSTDTQPAYLSQQQLRLFGKYLRAIYNETIVVKRPEFERLPLLVEQSRYIVLTGPRGGGKSTILHDCYRRLRLLHPSTFPLDLQPMPSHSVHLIDLVRHGPVLRYTAGSDEKKNICDLIYDLLRTAIFGSGSAKTRPGALALEDRWKLHKLETAAPYAELHRTIDDAHAIDGIDKLRLAEETYGVDWHASNRAFNSAAFEGKFECLLEFLANEGHTPIFLIDNADRYNRRLHEQMNTRVQHLANRGLTARFVVAFRASSYRNLKKMNQIDGATTLVQLLGQDDGSIPTEEDDLPEPVQPVDPPEPGSAPQGSDEPIHIHLDDSLYRAILVRRMSAVNHFLALAPGEWEATLANADHPEDEPGAYDALIRDLQAKAADGLADMGYSTFLDFEREVTRRLRKSTLNYTRLDPRQTMLRWHNYSIRSALCHHFDELSNSISGSDPLFPAPLGVAASAQTEATEHDYRTMLWRHLVTTRSGTGEIEVVGHVFTEQPSTTEISVFFPRLKLLQLLATHGELTKQSVFDRMRALGFAETATRDALEAMRRSRGYESGGFIRIDAPEELSVEEVRDATTVKIRPAGRYFLSFLVPSCEHIFWTAMLTPFDESWKASVPQLTGGRDRIERDDVLSDVFRAKVAAEFIRRWILPRYGIEGDLKGHTPARRRAQHEHFTEELCPKETMHQWFLPMTMASRLIGFIRTSPAADVKELPDQLETLQQLCKDRLERIKSL